MKAIRTARVASALLLAGVLGLLGTTHATIFVNGVEQPPARSIPQAARVPLARIALSADFPGIVNSITVTNAGTASDKVFTAIVLKDEDGNAIGDGQKLGADRQATIGAPFYLNIGETRTFTVVGETAVDLSNYQGTAATWVVAIDTAEELSGDPLPISGPTQTVDSSLKVGRLIVSADQSANCAPIRGAPRQVIAAFFIDTVSESVHTGDMVFQLDTVGGKAGEVSGLYLVSEDGAIRSVAADVAFCASEESVGKLVLAGITAPKGKTRFFLVGDVKSSFGINGTIKTTPLPDLWKGAHGVTSDYDIKPTKGTVASSMATVGGAVLKLSIDPTFQPPATVPAGTVQVEAVRIVLDASRSAEDIAVSTLLLHPLLDGVTTSAQLFDGAITLGSSVLVFPQTPKAAFSLDKGLLVVGKGTIKTLSLRCDVAAGAAGSFSFGLTADCGASACGTASYGTALVVVAPSDGQTITVAGGMPGKAHIESVTLGEEAGGQKFVDMAVGQTTPNGSYRVEQSSDLVHWHRVGTLFPGGTGLSVVRIPIDDEDCSFFRVVGEPSGR